MYRTSVSSVTSHCEYFTKCVVVNHVSCMATIGTCILAMHGVYTSKPVSRPSISVHTTQHKSNYR